MPTIILTQNGPCVLTCASHGADANPSGKTVDRHGGDDHHRLYPPRPPHHYLSASQPDQLVHVTVNPRVAKPVKMKKTGTTYSMAKVNGGYTGLDSISVSTSSNFNRTSELMAQHEALALSNRDDLVHLLWQKVACGQVNKPLAAWLLENSRHLFLEGSMTRFKDGATYVPFKDVIDIQTQASQDDSNLR